MTYCFEPQINSTSLLWLLGVHRQTMRFVTDSKYIASTNQKVNSSLLSIYQM